MEFGRKKKILSAGWPLCELQATQGLTPTGRLVLRDAPDYQNPVVATAATTDQCLNAYDAAHAHAALVQAQVAARQAHVRHVRQRVKARVQAVRTFQTGMINAHAAHHASLAGVQQLAPTCLPGRLATAIHCGAGDRHALDVGRNEQPTLSERAEQRGSDKATATQLLLSRRVVLDENDDGFQHFWRSNSSQGTREEPTTEPLNDSSGLSIISNTPSRATTPAASAQGEPAFEELDTSSLNAERLSPVGTQHHGATAMLNMFWWHVFVWNGYQRAAEQERHRARAYHQINQQQARLAQVKSLREQHRRILEQEFSSQQSNAMD
ncbi:uncharacterized protein MONBRDRAFT_27050 [Monosiga brevicollis MX1]|uniref:Uncharacterized protein n=1 Tax=Monosiga brevicollis TaxID=81824 RepID=A9V460_MONBE|nr:uncharacterized protein MONBRDRAFT_27050 [Monosiga brevicollis MX1]EDQ87649.1 predicted protein [Monosiga brevicollis MX1]|eukprot:XP_001747569.1 hypothetical protein [Monosiga brevicollis MX1]